MLLTRTVAFSCDAEIRKSVLEDAFHTSLVPTSFRRVEVSGKIPEFEELPP
jgi:hypothetical protein